MLFYREGLMRLYFQSETYVVLKIDYYKLQSKLNSYTLVTFSIDNEFFEKITILTVIRFNKGKFINFSATGIECFKCVSVNGSNPDCEDPFHNNRTNSFLEKPCMGGRKNRDGLFPASACLKLHGRYSKSSLSLNPWHPPP